jgi:alpha-tubulin suppressor-like RCC1 family protein
MAAGNDHLLALSSNGRTYAHPINKKANEYGQLGFRKFDMSDPSSYIPNTLLTLALIPKSFADPYAKASPLTRAPSSSLSLPSENLSNVNDSTIRFCTSLFEIPVLRGVEVAQVAAGGRSSYIRTQSGRVLGWGCK